MINGVPGGATFGQPCATDQDCTGPSERCSNHALNNGTIYPQPVCIAPCTAGDPTVLQPCAQQDGGYFLGYCVGDMPGQSAWCLPACGFDATTYTVACAGQNACQVRGVGIDTGTDAGRIDAMVPDSGPVMMTAPTVYGVGVCWGGCKTDTECTQGDHCQVETGECVSTLVAYTKATGDGCDSTTDQAACNCVASASTHQGYCSRVCTVGGIDCMSGYACSAQLPSSSGMVRFGGQPNGIQGHCLLRCTPAPVDAGVHDAAVVDAAVDAAGDVASPDVSAPDAGGIDAGGTDAAVVDAARPDVAVFRDVTVPDVPVFCPPNSLCQNTAGVANTCVPGNGM